ncbi:hypothetical protein ORL60_02230 [Klebsiella michiganensis]|nr:hypothetical protein [Klebsiella michiganensis]MCW9668092.1 hypothetical protein [Klebsiella michiganensis]
MHDDRMGDGMNISTVNELIQSLESAGKLSIKETKVMALAKAYLDVAAENAFILQLLHEQAGCFNAALIEGFHELVMESGSEGLIDVYQRRLQPAIQCVPPTPATDRIVAGIKADGVEEFIGRLQQHVDEGDFIGDEVAVIVGAIDRGKEFFEQLREGAK